jgi:hypothetical protein
MVFIARQSLSTWFLKSYFLNFEGQENMAHWLSVPWQAIGFAVYIYFASPGCLKSIFGLFIAHVQCGGWLPDGFDAL